MYIICYKTTVVATRCLQLHGIEFILGWVGFDACFFNNIQILKIIYAEKYSQYPVDTMYCILFMFKHALDILLCKPKITRLSLVHIYSYLKTFLIRISFCQKFQKFEISINLFLSIFLSPNIS